MTLAASSPPTTQGFVSRVWNWLIEPHASVVGSDRRTARLVSAILISLLILVLPIGFGQNIAQMISHQPGDVTSTGPVLILALLLFVAYLLSRTRYYRIGAGITAMATSVVIVASQLRPEADLATPGTTIMHMSIGVILAGFLLGRRGIIIVSVLNLVGIGIMKVIQPDLDLVANTTAIGFNVSIPILTLLAVSHRNQLEADRQAELKLLNLNLSESLLRANFATSEAQDANLKLIVARKQAEEASRLKDEFLSVMSHELRTPLNAIMGYQGILELIGALDGENLEMVQRTQANARRLLELINDVLDISRIEAGRLDIVPMALPLGEFVDRIQGQMQVLADQKQLDFDMTIDSTMPSVINIDEDALTKIVVNLLGNAFKFTEKGRVELRIERQDEQMQIVVCDTGVGIPSHMQEIIFERFRQVDGSSTRKYGGSGLGLSIVQQLCQLMGGKITVSSDTGRGSIFTVTLPLHAQSAPDAAEVERIN